MSDSAKRELKRFIGLSDRGCKMVVTDYDFSTKGLSIAMASVLEENEKLKQIIAVSECGKCGLMKIILS